MPVPINLNANKVVKARNKLIEFMKVSTDRIHYINDLSRECGLNIGDTTTVLKGSIEFKLSTSGKLGYKLRADLL